MRVNRVRIDVVADILAGASADFLFVLYSARSRLLPL